MNDLGVCGDIFLVDRGGWTFSMGWFGGFAGMFCVKGLGRHFLRGG